MADYSNLKKYQVTAANMAEYIFSEIEGEPSIWVSSATDDNEDFKVDRIRRSLADAEESINKPRGKDALNPTPESVAEDMKKSIDIDKRMIADCCARAWGKPPVDAAGLVPEFSADEVYDFLTALPDFMFVPFRNYCGNVRNFIGKKADPTQLGN